MLIIIDVLWNIHFMIKFLADIYLVAFFVLLSACVLHRTKYVLGNFNYVTVKPGKPLGPNNVGPT